LLAFVSSCYVLLHSSNGKLLLQRRHQSKSVFGGRVDLTVAEHLAPSESYIDAAVRGLKEELGIDMEPDSLYEAILPRKRLLKTESASGKPVYDFEFVPLFRGTYDGEAVPDMDEVTEVMWMQPHEIASALRTNASSWPTPWLENILFELKVISNIIPNEQSVSPIQE
jgi:isopentenyl-diphosphate delta-isomerase